MARIDSTAEIGKLMRRKRVKSNFVSSGTIRIAGMTPAMLRTVRTRMNAPSAMMIQNVTCAYSSNRHDFGPLPAHPHRNDQPRHRERGEDGGDDADAERDGKAADGTRADEEQNGSRDKGGDVGVENGR